MPKTIHEIRNHLAVAMAGIEACLDRKMEPTDARLSGIYHALQQVDALIDDLPRNRHVEFEVHAEPIDLCALIGAEVNAIEGFALEHGVELRVARCAQVSSQCARFLGDPIRIGEILTNLLTNAIRYTGAGGVVEVNCDRDGASLLLVVLDQGPGIRETEESKIFDVGYRGEAVGNAGGSGVGLALVKEFVEQHGGTVAVKNRTECGAAFTVRLPFVPLAAPACDGCSAPHEAVVLAGSPAQADRF